MNIGDLVKYCAGSKTLLFERVHEHGELTGHIPVHYTTAIVLEIIEQTHELSNIKILTSAGIVGWIWSDCVNVIS